MNDQPPDVCPKMFPLQASRQAPPGPRQIPWSIAEIAYGAYSRDYGSAQSLERLAERGGFGWCEMDTLYPQWRKDISEIDKLNQQITQLQAELAAANGLLEAVADAPLKLEICQQQLAAALRENERLQRSVLELQEGYAAVCDVGANVVMEQQAAAITQLQAALAAANAAKEQMRLNALLIGQSDGAAWQTMKQRALAAEADAKAKGEKLTAIEALATNPSWCYDDNDQHFQYVDPVSILVILDPQPEQANG